MIRLHTYHYQQDCAPWNNMLGTANNQN